MREKERETGEGKGERDVGERGSQKLVKVEAILRLTCQISKVSDVKLRGENEGKKNGVILNEESESRKQTCREC